MNSLSLCTTMTSPPHHFVNSLWRCSLQHLAMRYHLLHTKNQKIKKLVTEIMSGTAVNDKQNIIMANNEEHYSDSDLAHNTHLFFQSPQIVLQLKMIFLKNNFLKLSLKQSFESTVNTPIQS